MPELPEVETIVRSLRDRGSNSLSILGHTLKDAQILWSHSLSIPSEAELQKRIQKQIVNDVNRRGKYIIIHLSENYLIFHLRMSGDLRVEQAINDHIQSIIVQKHDRAIFTFTDGIRLILNDPRKFGRIWLVDDPNLVTGKLGPEPLDESFTPIDLYNKLKKKQSRIKSLLLDQHFLAGMGNIYSDEALFLAKLHPLQPANSITMDQAIILHRSIIQVLTEGIRKNGASIDWVYRGGGFQHSFNVYQRTGKPCLICESLIERIVIGQRGSHYCPVCQKFYQE